MAVDLDHFLYQAKPADLLNFETDNYKQGILLVDEMTFRGKAFRLLISQVPQKPKKSCSLMMK